MSQTVAVLQRLSTGSASLDEILGGGLPIRSLNVIAGEPGSGKTLFALQMLFHLAKQGKKCIYFTTLSEPTMKLIHYMQQFSFFDQELVGQNLLLIDLGSVIRGGDPDAALEAITSRVEQEEPQIVVIDSFKVMRDLFGDAPAVRTFVYDLSVHTAGWGAASLLLGEYTDEEMARYAEFAIADGIIRFSTKREELTSVRMVEVLKLRGSDCISGRHFFEIGSEGLTFFPRVRGPDAGHDPSNWSLADRASTGTIGLDEMFGGGFPRGSSTILQGGTGAGKTLFGLQFLMEGAHRKEPGILFTLEESAEQLRAMAQGFGWNLRELEKGGELTIHYVSPVELSTDSFLAHTRELIGRRHARRVVLDSLNSLELGIATQRRFKELVYAMTKHFGAQGVTSIMTMDIPDQLGTGHLSGHGISFASDNVILLKYVELNGSLERGISVLKARGVRHSTAVRRVNFEARGVEIGGPFKDLRGVLTGLPVPATVT